MEVEGGKDQPSFVNDAFIGYSKKDREIAACLEKSLNIWTLT